MAEVPEQRIGDRERARTDARLRAAHDDGVLTLVEYDERAAACYAARFARELESLVADLPPVPGAPAPAPAPAPTGRHPGRRGRAHTDRHRGLHRRGLHRLVPVAVLAVVVAVVGPGVIEADQGSAVFGSRTVQVVPGQTDADVGVLFGSVEVVVPDGTTVRPSGTVVFGSLECDRACAPGPTSAPPVVVDGHGAFGSVDVVTASQAARGEEPDDDDDG